MENPFELIISRLDKIYERLSQTNNTANVEESYLKIEAAAAAFLSSTRGALQIMTHRKTIPHIKKMDKLYFRKSDFVKWLEDDAVNAQQNVTLTSIAKSKTKLYF